ncbi:hypothetical protein ACTS9D_00755 [Empedobacter brevis]
MQKVELKVNSDKLNLIIELLNYMSNENSKNNCIDSKFHGSIFLKLLKQLSKKNIDKIDVQKEFKLSFEYHYGYIIFEALQTALEYNHFASNPYKSSLTRTMSNQIHQQL